MGVVRKWTGVDSQIKASNANAAVQIEATKKTAADQQAALMQTAKQAAQQQVQLAARSAAEEAAAAAVSQPLGTVDVQIDENLTESVAALRRKKLASFGKNYQGGVSI